MAYDQWAVFGAVPAYYWRMTNPNEYDPDYEPIPSDTLNKEQNNG
jgi:hypothetical protein